MSNRSVNRVGRPSAARYRARRAAAVAVLVAVCAAAFAACGGSAAPQKPAARPASAGQSAGAAPALTVSATDASAPVPAGFVGLSLEYKDLEHYAGTNPSALDPVFVQLVRNIAPDGGPVLRIGGDSTDWTWWPVPGMTKPGGVTYALGDRFSAVARALAQELDAKLSLGVDFEANSRRVASYEADRLLTTIGPGSISAFELGNEPELYAAFGWYRNAEDVSVPGRAGSWDFDAFLSDYRSVASAMPKRVVLAGPSTGSTIYLSTIGAFARAERSSTHLVTIHAYPLKHCGGASSPAPTVSELLSPASTSGFVAGVQGWVDAVRGAGVPVRLDEMNAVSCGGWSPVTNSFAASLWTLQTVMHLASSGVSGVNFHTINNTSQRLIHVSEHDGGWTGVVLPEYYGLVAFARAVPAGSRVLRVDGTQSARVQTFAVTTPAHVTNLVVVNTSSAAHTVRVHVPGASAAGTVTRLSGPSLTAQSGVTLGGQRVDPHTGALTGTAQTTTVTPSGDLYAVGVPAGSAAIVAIPSGS